MFIHVDDEDLLELLTDAVLRLESGSLIVITDADEPPSSVDDGYPFLVPPWGGA